MTLEEGEMENQYEVRTESWWQATPILVFNVIHTSFIIKNHLEVGWENAFYSEWLGEKINFRVSFRLKAFSVGLFSGIKELIHSKRFLLKFFFSGSKLNEMDEWWLI